jgi:hypothetical protein
MFTVFTTGEHPGAVRVTVITSALRLALGLANPWTVTVAELGFVSVILGLVVLQT